MARRTASGRLSARGPADGGYALAALLTGLAVMGLAMSLALPVWSQAARRERELELIFRGEQYARAVELYQRVFAGAYPPDLDTLIEQRFLRRRYRDPMVADGQFRIVYQAEVSALPGEPAAAPVLEDSPPAGELRGGVAGVVSRSPDESIRIYNGRSRYNEWVFVYGAEALPPPASTNPPFVTPPDAGRAAASRPR